MKRLIQTTVALLAVLVLSGCPEPTMHQATVELTIDGTSYDYQTSHGQWDQQEEGGRYSIYLLPADPNSGAPYVCMRTYVGNPVAQLWVRYDKPGVQRDEEAGLGKYECFVPGTLSDGRQTLGWANTDGSERHRNETGDANCTGSLVREGNELRLSFDAKLPLFVKKKKGKKKGEKKVADTIEASGSAVLQLTAR